MAAKQCFRFALLSTAISGFYNCIIWLLGHVCNVFLVFLFVFLGVGIAYSQSAELWFQVRYEKRMMDMSACAIYTKCEIWKAHRAGKSAKMRRQTYINNHFSRNIEKTSFSNFSSLVFSFVGHIKFPQSYYCQAHHQPPLFSFSLFIFNVQKHLRVINWYYITWYSINLVLVLPKEMLIKREWFRLLFFSQTKQSVTIKKS